MNQPSVHQLYQRLETVGKGGYGSVHKGRHIPTGNIVALKIINLDTPDDDVDDIQREVTLLSQLRDAPNITKYYGCYMDGPRVWIVMEFAQGGSVDALMKASKDGCLEEKFASVITREVLVGLSYLHKVPVIHRDMKSANILITATGKVMICDFGVSALLATTTSKRNTLIGTPYWMAPEVVQSVAAYDTKADIWSLGIMVYEMIKGSPPHSNLDRFQVMELIPRVKPPRLPEQEGSKDMREFMANCLKELPTERLPADELLKTRWIKSVSKVGLVILKDLVTRLKQVGPRASLATPLDWEKEANEPGFTDDDSDWEFETVRGRSLNQPHGLPFENTPNNLLKEGQDSEQHTIRAPTSTFALPTSLRMLFEDNSAPQPDSYRPLLQSVNIPLSSSGPTQLSEKTFKQLAPQLISQEVPRSQNPSIVHVSTAPSNKTSPAVKLQNIQPDGFASSPQEEEAPGTVETHQVSFQSTHIPPQSHATPESPTFSTADTKLVHPSSPPARPHGNRRRSRSSAEASDYHHDRDLASPGAFRFPLNPNFVTSVKGERNGVDTLSTLKPHELNFSGSHQAAHSLGTIPQHSGLQPPVFSSISRASSATIIQASDMHSNFNLLPTEEPIPHIPKPLTRAYLDHSGENTFTSNRTLGTPGLKDVLKVPSLSSEHHLGFKDLLPPSPSPSASHSRTHVPAQPSAGADSYRSSSPFPPIFPSERDYQNDMKIMSPFTLRPTNISALPPTKALDYTSLMNTNRGQLHTEMTKTIEQLAGWLGVLEGGLTSMIDERPNDIIEEEEPIPAIEGQLEGNQVLGYNNVEETLF